MHKHYTKGFSLVELSMVIAVIAIMTTVGVVAYTSVQKDSRNSKRSADMTVLVNELEKFYDKKGEYPPGCPDTTCPNALHTTNTSSAALTPSTTLTTLMSILPGVKSGLGDPQSTNKTLPFKNRTVAEKKYYYFGGTVNYTGATATVSFATHANFPCTIQSSLLAGQVGSFVLGYFDEKTSTWILEGGRNGTAMTVTAGTCVINRG
jgi:prepilin-type N-terminal cleavage/methylation domain-containing protein